MMVAARWALLVIPVVVARRRHGRVRNATRPWQANATRPWRANATALGGAPWPAVELGCALEEDFGARTLHLVAASGRRETILGDGGGDGGAAPGAAPLLCARRYDDVGKRTALLTIATDAAYLRPWALYVWNKLCYCGRERVDFLLFLGDIDAGVAPSPRCALGRASNHWIKAVAVHAALERAGVDEVLVLDTDAVVTRSSFLRPGLLECYFAFLGAGVDVAAGTEHYQVFVNAAVLMVRRGDWARALLELWWTDRCGDKDQLVLWHALFTLWSFDAPALAYDGRLLDYVSRNYSSGSLLTYKHARRVVVFDFVKAVWPQYLRKAAGARGAGLHHLREDLLLEFPHFLMFPMAPTAPRPGTCGGDALPAFRAVPAKGRPGPRGAGAPFLTHTKHRPAFDCCPAGLAGATDCVDVALPDADAGGDNVPHR